MLCYSNEDKTCWLIVWNRGTIIAWANRILINRYVNNCRRHTARFHSTRNSCSWWRACATRACKSARAHSRSSCCVGSYRRRSRTTGRRSTSRSSRRSSTSCSLPFSRSRISPFERRSLMSSPSLPDSSSVIFLSFIPFISSLSCSYLSMSLTFQDEDGTNRWPEVLQFLFELSSSTNVSLRESSLNIFT